MKNWDGIRLRLNLSFTFDSAHCVKETSSLTSKVEQLRQPALESYQAMSTIGGLYTLLIVSQRQVHKRQRWSSSNNQHWNHTKQCQPLADCILCLLCQGDKFANIKGGAAPTTSIGIIPSNANHWRTVYSAYCVKETSSLTSKVEQLQQPALESYQAMSTIGGLYTLLIVSRRHFY